MAWRSDGMFAYAQGVRPEYCYNKLFAQRVVVQQGLEGRPEVWSTDEAFYTVAQWAGDTLLVWRDVPRSGGEHELLAFDGPGVMRTVLGPYESLLAVSPDGSRLLTWSGGPSQAEEPLSLHETDLKTGRQIARLSLDGVADPATGHPITYLASGAWEGDRLVVSLAPADLAIVSTQGGRLTLENVVTFSYPKLHAGSIAQVLLDGQDKVVAVTSEGDDIDDLERTAVVTYDLTSGECGRWIAPGQRAITGLVCNPSRPLQEKP